MSQRLLQFNLRRLLLLFTAVTFGAWLFAILIFPLAKLGQRSNLGPREEAALVAMESQGVSIVDHFT